MFAFNSCALGGADRIVLSGTRVTVVDLAWLRVRGLDRTVLVQAAVGKFSGLQMLGEVILESNRIEGSVAEVAARSGIRSSCFGVRNSPRQNYPR